MPPIKLAIALILSCVLAVFGAQNTQSVTFYFLTFELGPAPVILAVFIAALVGALLSWIVSAPGQFRGMLRRRQLEPELADAQVQSHPLASSTAPLPGQGLSPHAEDLTA
jgi:uncharacterized integral membrane protein